MNRQMRQTFRGNQQ